MATAVNSYGILKDSFCIRVSGADAVTIVNNLTTNDIAKLSVNGCCEAFVTNVRGWVVAHGLVAKTDDGILLVGQHPDPVQICNHIDRYIIREDAKVLDLSQERSILLVRDAGTLGQIGGVPVDVADMPVASFKLDGISVLRIASEMAGANEVWLCDSQDVEAVQAKLASCGVSACGESEMELNRIKAFWPATGREISEKTIPQELDRDERSISFTKGCYLGQETIARLDARGQLQKKIALLCFATAVEPAAGDVVSSAEKEVGSITSVAIDIQRTLALATIKRGAFAIGTQLTCNGEVATVVDPRQL